MGTTERTYIAIDLKSFYASVECVDRGLDPLDTNLVVADESRTENTICLAVSPSLKSFGIGGRARLFEVVQRVREVNGERRRCAGGSLSGKSYSSRVITDNHDYEVEYIVAKPRMARYMEMSANVYSTYLKYISSEDIHVYSIDEVFMDVTSYLRSYKMTAHELAMTIIKDVLSNTGITATAGIGTNMYLCKVAMDIVAKHVPADKDGVRIAELDENKYRRTLWDYKPLTKFWRIGSGIAEKLAPYGIDTMGKIARVSLENEEFLYRLFGVNAELIIDHAWGWEPCTIDLVKAYKPETRSVSNGQVLSCPYDFRKALTVVREMADAIALDLVEKRLVTDQLVLSVGYDRTSITDSGYDGAVVYDHYGRKVPKPAHGTVNLKTLSSSAKIIMEAVASLYKRIVNPTLTIRRLNITANHLVYEDVARKKTKPIQLSLFDDYEEVMEKKKKEDESLEKERRIQQARLSIKQRFGNNAILRGLNFDEGATAIERNSQIGGHKA